MVAYEYLKFDTPKRTYQFEIIIRNLIISMFQLEVLILDKIFEKIILLHKLKYVILPPMNQFLNRTNTLDSYKDGNLTLQ